MRWGPLEVHKLSVIFNSLKHLCDWNFELSRSLEPEEGVVGGRVKIEMLWIHGKQRIICLVCFPFLLIFSLPSFFIFFFFFFFFLFYSLLAFKWDVVLPFSFVYVALIAFFYLNNISLCYLDANGLLTCYTITWKKKWKEVTFLFC